MGFFSLAHSQKTLAIKNKNRVAFVVSLKINQIFVFFQDGCFQHHYCSSSQQNVIKNGKLDFVPTQFIKSQFKDRIFLKGNGKANNGSLVFAFINLYSKNFQPYQCVMRRKQDIFASAKHHILKCSQKHQHFFIIELIPNVQNGLAVACFDFLNNIWSSQMIFLNSKHLNCKFINTTNLDQVNKTWSFTLLAHGQKFESILYNKFQIQYRHQSNKEKTIDQVINGKQGERKGQNEWILKHGFLSVKELKFFRNFTILGAHPSFKEGHSQFLYVVGNSTSLQSPSQKSQCNLPAVIKINMSSTDQNIDQKIIFKKLSEFKIGKQNIMREYLGVVDNDMVMLVQNNFKKSIHKIRIPVSSFEMKKQQKQISPKKYANQKIYDEEVESLCNQFTTKNIQVSLDGQVIFSHLLKCQQFFQKIKDSPSVLSMQAYTKIHKKVYYNKILESMSSKQEFNQQFCQNVLSLL